MIGKNHSIPSFIHAILLIMVFCGAVRASILAQDDSLRVKITTADSSKIQKPRIVESKELLGETMFLSATDSIASELKNKRIYLYNRAKITYGTTILTANYMIVDMESKEVLATFTEDSLGNRLGEPVFLDGADSVKAGTLRFNFETKRAFIEETRISQEETFLFMQMAKKQANDELHFRHGRFSTCDLDEPHFHFHLSEAVLVPNERVVAGPSNLWIMGVPTPLVLPFAYFPTKKQAQTGLIFPQIVPLSPNGTGLQDLGYYFPINDKLNTTVFGTIYSRGSFGFANESNYNFRYKANGSARIDFMSFGRPFPDTTRANTLNVRWNHNQDPKANPYWRFSANVNFMSNNNPQQTLNPLNQDVFNSAVQSTVTINRNFPGKPYTMGARLGVNQNSQTKNMSVDLPTMNFNMSRVHPLKFLRSKEAIGPERWYEKIGLTYTGEMRNQANFGDSLLTEKAYRNQLPDRFLNGMNHQFNLTSNVQLLKGNLNLVPNLSYTNFINFQSITPSWDNELQGIQPDSTRGFYMGHNMNLRVNATTTVYSMFQMIGLKNVRFRNITRPSLGYSFVPKLNQVFTTFNQNNQSVQRYTLHDQSLYRSATTNDQSLINFGLSHTTEMKAPSKRDSTGIKKIGLIEGFDLRGSYDMLRDSFNLSDISMNLRVKPLEFWNIVGGANYSLYDWVDSSKAPKPTFAFARETDRELGRFMNLNLASTFTFSSKEGQKIISETDQRLKENWLDDYQYYMLRPYEVMDFRIPWRINLSYNLVINRNTRVQESNPELFSVVQTITYQADLTLTPRWMISSRGTFDIKAKNFSTLAVDINRNIHCWNMSFSWIPVGFNKSFMLRIAANASMLSDVKYEFRKPPAFL